MSPDTLQLIQDAGYTSIPKQLQGGQPAMPSTQPSSVPQPQQEELISFDDPRFLEYLIASGSPEAAEKLWAELTGANRVFQQVDERVAALLQTNPDLSYNQALNIAEAEKARLRAQAPGLQALVIAKQRLTEKQEAAKGVQSKFNGDQWALLQELVASGVPSIEATRQVVEKIPFSSISGESGEGGSLSLKNMDLLTPEAQAAVKGVFNAEQLNRAPGGAPPEAAIAKNILKSLNPRDQVGDGSSPCHQTRGNPARKDGRKRPFTINTHELDQCRA